MEWRTRKRKEGGEEGGKIGEREGGREGGHAYIRTLELVLLGEDALGQGVEDVKEGADLGREGGREGGREEGREGGVIECLG